MKLRWLAPSFVAIVLFGAALRIVRLHSAPPGLFFDEAANLFDIADVLKGARPLYFPANNGREPFFFYWASLFASYLGNTPYSLRLSGAVIGTLTLPATFLCAREASRCWYRDRRWSDGAALAATFVLGITYFHLHYSRYGLRTISMPFFLALSYGFLFRALRRQSIASATASGLFGGLSTYTYIASRLAPVVLIVPFVFGIARRPLRRVVPLVIWVGILWVLVSVPLGIYYLRHPQSVEGHTDDVSILNPANNNGDPIGAVLHGAIATFGAFNFRGSLASDQNLAGRPILDPLLSVFFALGLLGAGRALVARSGDTGNALTLTLSQRERGSEGSVVAGLPSGPSAAPTTNKDPAGNFDSSGSLSLWERVRVRAFPVPSQSVDPSGATDGSLRPLVALFLIAWIADQSAPSVFSVSPPGYVRLTGTLPAVAIVVGIGIATACRWFRDHSVSRRVTLAILSVCLAASTAWTVRDYFFVWAPSVDAYNWMMAPKVDAANYLRPLATTDRVFLAPLWATDNTVKFMTRGAPIQTFDIGQTVVIPTDRSRDVHYFFPASDPEEAARVASELPTQPTAATVTDPSGRNPILLRLDLPRANLPAVPESAATLEDGIGLVGATITPSTVAPGGEVEVTLEWLSLRASSDDYTIFIHLRDPSEGTLAQADGRPGAGSYPTNAWRPGDLVFDRHRLTIPPTAKPGAYHVAVGMYRLATLKRLQANLPQGRAANDEVPAGAFAVSGP